MDGTTRVGSNHRKATMLGASNLTQAHGAYDPHVGPGQIVLVFQGGGALGAYQAGVYQALHEAGIEPDWIIGTSIGAINGSLAADVPDAILLEHSCPRHTRLFRAQPDGVLGHTYAARGRQGRLLLDVAAREDTRRARRLLARKSLQAAPDRRC